MRIARRVVGIVVGIVSLTACAHPVPTTEPQPNAAGSGDAPADVPRPVLLEVDNRNSSDVEISIEHGGVKTRLGIVTAQTSQTFQLPPAWIVPAARLALLARAIGGRGSSSYRSGSVIVRPGQRIDFMLESGLQRSSYAVF